MRKIHAVPERERLRRALQWIGAGRCHNLQTLEEACRRFDLTPGECEFVYRHFGARRVELSGG